MKKDEWWWRQLSESMKEASKLFDSFRASLEPNVEEFDAAIAIHEECCWAYDLNKMSFNKFIETGKSLRARQAYGMILKDYHHE